MDKKRQPIGVFDSGVGGLTVVNKLRKLLPYENIVFLGDSKRNPYGSRSKEELLRFSREILHFLTEQQVKLVAIGCNTVTASVYDIIRNETAFPLIGMSRGIQTAREISLKKKIAVFATDVTIANHVHRNMAAQLDPEIEIIEQACPGIADCVEQGKLQGPEIMSLLRKYTAPVLASGADTAIFGCTHYPFVQPLFEELCGDKIVFVDPAHEMSLQTLEILKKDSLLNHDRLPGYLRLCFTAEAERGARLAEHLIPANEFTVEKIEL
ncbi:MAG: glutamate racemase [Megasphaera sp.]|nr:glutamate racemase [Megasphaera sp.]MCI1247472.1 glutamate racemase [Megasphaera sp.]